MFLCDLVVAGCGASCFCVTLWLLAAVVACGYFMSYYDHVIAGCRGFMLFFPVCCLSFCLIDDVEHLDHRLGEVGTGCYAFLSFLACNTVCYDLFALPLFVISRL